MSGVDVLAVMDRAVSMIDDQIGIYASGELEDARDAIAELIGKADNAAVVMQNLISAGQVDAGYQSILDDLRAALAKVGAAS